MPVQRSSAKKGGFLGTLWRVLRQVFHESTGIVFLVLGLFWSAAAIRQWMSGSAKWTWAALGAFALMMMVFALTSFRAARRVR